MTIRPNLEGDYKQRLKDLRTESGMSMQTFALTIKRSKASISQMESGKTYPTYNYIDAIIKNFVTKEHWRVNKTWLWRGVGERFDKSGELYYTKREEVYAIAESFAETYKSLEKLLIFEEWLKDVTNEEEINALIKKSLADFFSFMDVTEDDVKNMPEAKPYEAMLRMKEIYELYSVMPDNVEKAVDFFEGLRGTFKQDTKNRHAVFTTNIRKTKEKFQANAAILKDFLEKKDTDAKVLEIPDEINSICSELSLEQQMEALNLVKEYNKNKSKAKEDSRDLTQSKYFEK